MRHSKSNKNITIVNACEVMRVSNASPEDSVNIMPCGVGEMTVIKMAAGFKVTINSDGEAAMWDGIEIKNVIDIFPRQHNGIIEDCSMTEQFQIINEMIVHANSKSKIGKDGWGRSVHWEI